MVSNFALTFFQIVRKVKRAPAQLCKPECKGRLQVSTYSGCSQITLYTDDEPIKLLKMSNRRLKALKITTEMNQRLKDKFLLVQ